MPLTARRVRRDEGTCRPGGCRRPAALWAERSCGRQSPGRRRSL